MPWPLFGILPKIARHGRHHKGLEPEADDGPINIHNNEHLHSVGLSLKDSEAAIPMISEVHHVVYHRLWFISKARIIASHCLEVTGSSLRMSHFLPQFSLPSVIRHLFFSQGVAEHRGGQLQKHRAPPAPMLLRMMQPGCEAHG